MTAVDVSAPALALRLLRDDLEAEAQRRGPSALAGVVGEWPGSRLLNKVQRQSRGRRLDWLTHISPPRLLGALAEVRAALGVTS